VAGSADTAARRRVAAVVFVEVVRVVRWVCAVALLVVVTTFVFVVRAERAVGRLELRSTLRTLLADVGSIAVSEVLGLMFDVAVTMFSTTPDVVSSRQRLLRQRPVSGSP
jgi:Ni,Fe-hydrogenase I cytochrome b subunit